MENTIRMNRDSDASDAKYFLACALRLRRSNGRDVLDTIEGLGGVRSILFLKSQH